MFLIKHRPAPTFLGLFQNNIFSGTGIWTNNLSIVFPPVTAGPVVKGGNEDR